MSEDTVQTPRHAARSHRNSVL